MRKWRPILLNLLSRLRRYPSVWVAGVALGSHLLGYADATVLAIFLVLAALLGWEDFQRRGERRLAAAEGANLAIAGRLTEALSLASGVGEVRRLILSHLLAELGWKRAALWTHDRVGRHDVLVPVAAEGIEMDRLLPFVYRLDRSVDIMARAILDRTPLLVRNAPDDWRCDQRLVSGLGLSDYIVVPMVTADRGMGAILLDAEGHRRGMEGLATALMHCARAGALALENATLLDRVQQMAEMDGLTGLYNHRHFQEALRKELDRANRFPDQMMHFSLIMADVDVFKSLNDTYGHQAGDTVLTQVGQIFRNCTRQSDLVARYGGEEFVALLPSTPKAGAMILAERLREAVESHSFGVGRGQEVKVTISLGVATFEEDGTTGPDIIKAADEGLYAAKHAGRNKVICVNAPPK